MKSVIKSIRYPFVEELKMGISDLRTRFSISYTRLLGSVIYSPIEKEFKIQMGLLKLEDLHTQDELERCLNRYVNRFPPIAPNSRNSSEVAYEQIKNLASDRGESENPQETVKWLFDGLENAETFMRRFQDIRE